jgi:hypothetical protein
MNLQLLRTSKLTLFALLTLFGVLQSSIAALNFPETIMLERYTVINDWSYRYEMGNLLRNGSFRVLLSSVDTAFGDDIEQITPISGRPIMDADLFDAYKTLGIIPRWVRSRYEYSIGFSSFVVVSTVGGPSPDPKPTFSVQPVDQSVVVGYPLFLAGFPTSLSGVEIQWYKNGRAIPGATSLIYAPTVLSRRDSGRYSVKLTLGRSFTWSRTAIVTVIEPVVITRDLKNATVKPLRSVIFAASARGTAPFTYRWYHNDERIPNATKRTLVLRRVSASDAGEYRVEICNSDTCADSSTVTLSVTP